jgi:hypothetical protein
MSLFSPELVRSMEARERALSSQRVLEKVNATTGVCWRWDRKWRRESHTARSWRRDGERDAKIERERVKKLYREKMANGEMAKWRRCSKTDRCASMRMNE